MKWEILSQLSVITEEEKKLLEGKPLDLSIYNRSGGTVMDPGSLLPDGSLFGIRPHTRFTDFPMHSHFYVEMIYQVTGKTEHIMESGTQLTLNAGQLLLLSRGTSHAIRACGQEDIAVNFILIPAFFDNAAIALGESNALSVFLKANLATRKVAAAYLLFDIAGDLMIENLLENLIAGNLSGVSLRIQQMTLEVLLQHLSLRSGKLMTRTREERERAIVLDVLSRVEQQVRLNLGEIADELGLDVTALSRMIKKHTGCTFTELLHTARFNRAVTLLRDTEMSIADVATTVGYENTAFFYRRFAKLYGCTPAEYRERLRTGAAT